MAIANDVRDDANKERSLWWEFKIIFSHANQFKVYEAVGQRYSMKSCFQEFVKISQENARCRGPF